MFQAWEKSILLWLFGKGYILVRSVSISQGHGIPGYFQHFKRLPIDRTGTWISQEMVRTPGMGCHRSPPSPR